MNIPKEIVERIIYSQLLFEILDLGMDFTRFLFGCCKASKKKHVGICRMGMGWVKSGG